MKSAASRRLADRADAAVHHVGRRDDVAAGFRLHQRLLDQNRDGLVVENDAVAQQAVMAVAGKGIERDVAEDADLGHFLLDGADGAADQIVRVERLAARLVAQRRIGVGEQRDAGDAQLGGALGLAHRLIDAQALDARHRRHRRARLVAVHHEQRPDQVVGGERRSRAPCGAPIRCAGCGACARSGRAGPACVSRASCSTGMNPILRSRGRPNLIAIDRLRGSLFSRSRQSPLPVLCPYAAATRFSISAAALRLSPSR